MSSRGFTVESYDTFKELHPMLLKTIFKKNKKMKERLKVKERGGGEKKRIQSPNLLYEARLILDPNQV